MRNVRDELHVRLHSAFWRALLRVFGISVPRRFRPTLGFDANAPVLVLSPHPDDAVLNCWSVLTSEGDVSVVNVFAGQPRAGFVSAVDRSCGAEDSAEHVRTRLAEDERVLASVGRRPLNLNFLDIQYGARRLTLQALDRAVAAVVPRASRAYAPAALAFAHADHLLVREYARALARAGLPITLYADIPYAAALGWPGWVVGRPADGDAADARWRASLRPVRELGQSEVVELEPAAADAKGAAMRAYATQFDFLNVDDRLTDPEVYGREVFWSLRGPSRAQRTKKTAPSRPL